MNSPANIIREYLIESLSPATYGPNLASGFYTGQFGIKTFAVEAGATYLYEPGTEQGLGYGMSGPSTIIGPISSGEFVASASLLYLPHGNPFGGDWSTTPTDAVVKKVIGGSSPWDIFVSFMPSKPDECLCVYDTPGKEDGRMQRTGEKIVHPGIQIRVRGKNYLSTYQLTKQIAETLDQIKNVSVAMESDLSYILVNVSRTGDVLPLGMETDSDRRRHLMAINATVTIRPAM